jgi:hypothetical protein
VFNFWKITEGNVDYLTPKACEYNEYINNYLNNGEHSYIRSKLRSQFKTNSIIDFFNGFPSIKISGTSPNITILNNKSNSIENDMSDLKQNYLVIEDIAKEKITLDYDQQLKEEFLDDNNDSYDKLKYISSLKTKSQTFIKREPLLLKSDNNNKDYRSHMKKGLTFIRTYEHNSNFELIEQIKVLYNDFIKKYEIKDKKSIINNKCLINNKLCCFSKFNKDINICYPINPYSKKIIPLTNLTDILQVFSKEKFINEDSFNLVNSNIRTNTVQNILNKFKNKYVNHYITQDMNNFNNIKQTLDLFKLNVKIFNDNNICIFDSNTETYHLYILYTNNKYFIIDNEIINKKEINIKYKSRLYFFFDYETVYCRETGILNTYSVACVVYDIYQNIKNIYFDSDIEFKQLNYNFIKFLLSFSSTENIMTAYNGSRFDNLLLLDGLSLHSKNIIGKTRCNTAGNSIIKLMFNNFTVIDLCRFTMCPLKDACQNYKCLIQKVDGFDHSLVQDQYDNNTLHIWLNDNFEKIYEYNLGDVLSLAELFFKMQESFLELTNIDISKEMTIAGLCYKHWQNLTKNKFTDENEILAPETREVADFFRKSNIGGRNQVFYDLIKKFREEDYNKWLNDKDDINRLRYKEYLEISKQNNIDDLLSRSIVYGDIGSIDFKSSYPFCMIAMNYPIGREQYTPSYIEGKLGIYNVEIIRQPEINIIPNRTKESPLDWAYKGKINCVLNTVDINALKKYNSEIIIKDGYYWENSSQEVFYDYIIELKDIKTLEDYYAKTNDFKYNPSRRAIVKLMLNSLSGKPNQKEYDTSFEICVDANKIKSFYKKNKDISFIDINQGQAVILKGKKKDKKYNSSIAKPVQLGSFIYSYARTNLYSTISKLDYVFYTDTDSLHVPRNSIIKLTNQNNIINNYNDIIIKLENAIKSNDTEHIRKYTLEKYKTKYGNFSMGNDFGDMEDEISFYNIKDNKKVSVPGHTNYYVAKKTYGLYQEERMPNDYDDKDLRYRKEKLKGVGKNDKRIYIDYNTLKLINKNYQINEIEFNQLSRKNKISLIHSEFNLLSIQSKSKIYNILKPAISEQIFYDLIYGKIVCVLSSRLNKSILNNDKFSTIEQNFIIKDISNKNYILDV